MVGELKKVGFSQKFMTIHNPFILKLMVVGNEVSAYMMVNALCHTVTC